MKVINTVINGDTLNPGQLRDLFGQLREIENRFPGVTSFNGEISFNLGGMKVSGLLNMDSAEFRITRVGVNGKVE